MNIFYHQNYIMRTGLNEKNCFNKKIQWFAIHINVIFDWSESRWLMNTVPLLTGTYLGITPAQSMLCSMWLKTNIVKQSYEVVLKITRQSRSKSAVWCKESKQWRSSPQAYSVSIMNASCKHEFIFEIT